MTLSRRTLLSLFPAALLAKVELPTSELPEGIIDYSVQPYSPAVLHLMDQCSAGRPYRCFVDGVEIQQVWYCDQKSGIVKSQDVLYDNKAHHNLERLQSYEVALARMRDITAGNVDPDWELRPNRNPKGGSILSKTIRGKVELRQG